MTNPFDPKGGKFAENIRSITGDDSELRESMKRAGWIKHLPAFTDENDVVIVGHRRLKIAKELGIKPVIQQLTFGKGDTADTKRLQLAIASNTGGKGLTKGDRKRIATHLYSKQEWTMQAIAEALNVSQKTISQDLEGLYPEYKPSRPKGGRPKGSKKPRDEKRMAEDQAAATMVLDEGKTLEQAAAAVGHNSIQKVKIAVAKEEGKREAKAEPEIKPADLSMTAQEKLDAAIRQHRRKLDLAFEQRVRAEVVKRIDEIMLPMWKERIKDAKTLYERRKALMDKETFNTIRRALHPDSRNSISDKKLGEAFDTFMGLEKYLLNEKDSPTKFEYPDGSGIPDNLAAWDKMRMKKTTKQTKNSVAPR